MKSPGRLTRKAPLKPGKPLARTKPMNRRAAPLAVVSKTRQAGRRVQGKAYAGAPDAEQDWCECCEKVLPLDHSHLLTQKQYPHLANNPLNWLKMCRADHRLFEDNKAAFAEKYPDVWALIQDRILQVGGMQALAFFQLKNPYKPIL